jgi:putative ABC transport system ATP-binding protein
MKNLIEIERLKYSYLQGNQKSVPVLQGLDLAVRSGEFIAVTGPSGSGKTTLINIIGLLTDLQRGSYVLDGHDISKISTREKENLRARYIGFIFQDYLLLDHLSVAENVLLPLQYSNLNRSDKNHLAHEILERLGISSLLKRKPSQLSGGQKQRVAIARAIVKKPRLIIADEPASALDPVNRLEVLKTLQELSFSGTAVLMVTHSDEDARVATRRISIADGQILGDEAVLSRRILLTHSKNDEKARNDFHRIALDCSPVSEIVEKLRTPIESHWNQKTLSVISARAWSDPEFVSAIRVIYTQLSPVLKSDLINEALRRGSFQNRSWSLLIANLKQDDFELLNESALAGLLNDKFAAPFLNIRFENLLGNDSALVRATALSKLKFQPDSAISASERIRALLVDPNSRVRSEAMECLASIQRVGADESLLESWPELSPREWGLSLYFYLRENNEVGAAALEQTLSKIWSTENSSLIRSTYFGLSALPPEDLVARLERMLKERPHLEALLPDILTAIERGRSGHLRTA